jgi:hypothetical protein
MEREIQIYREIKQKIKNQKNNDKDENSFKHLLIAKKILIKFDEENNQMEEEFSVTDKFRDFEILMILRKSERFINTDFNKSNLQ